MHKGLNAVRAKGQYKTELLPHGNVQVAIAAEGRPCLNLPETSPEFGKNVAAYYFWFFPNIKLNFYP